GALERLADEALARHLRARAFGAGADQGIARRDQEGAGARERRRHLGHGERAAAVVLYELLHVSVFRCCSPWPPQAAAALRWGANQVSCQSARFMRFQILKLLKRGSFACRSNRASTAWGRNSSRVIALARTMSRACAASAGVRMLVAEPQKPHLRR